MSLEEDGSDNPPPNPSRLIVNLHIDNIAVYHPSFAKVSSRITPPFFNSTDAACIQYNWMRANGDHGDIGAAFCHLRLNNSYIQGTADFAPTRLHSVHVAIRWCPQSSEAIFSALGFPQDEATVEVDFRI